MLRLVVDRFDPPAFDTAVSAAVLARVAAGTDPPTLRLWSPLRAVAFGRQDRARPGYRAAVAAVTGLGFAAVERLAGGRAAVFHEGTLAFSWAMPDSAGPAAIRPRFAAVSGLVAEALAGLGLDARIGEIPGEYCPGEWSVNLSGRHKVMGVGQRLIRGGAHVGGVIVVADAPLVNRPLLPAYRLLEYEWRPEATGAVDNVLVGASPHTVAAALLDAIREGGEEITTATLDDDCLELAAVMAPEHDPTG